MRNKYFPGFYPMIFFSLGPTLSSTLNKNLITSRNVIKVILWMKQLTRILTWKNKTYQWWICVWKQVGYYSGDQVYAPAPKPTDNSINLNRDDVQSLLGKKTNPL